ncbi:NADP-dependent phosphogluconate dehydrogenase [Gleimia hominis]|uniref:6-phosphogluconate dehydrogenase, decarboxylating n=1 Tax=Gleimia hominis TaxID=595468 RepID=A0ABU3IBB9_9ACTO|nr:NADP-dependent phosphogluconate dehydrogenase [Gleimia hominis]MDT3766762.1 NADP-dependent phosphogluconate dehydrogenase [Gleimia hominis]
MTIETPAPASADIGVWGMGVMGSNLARNLARNGYDTAVGNRTEPRTERFIQKHGSEAEFVPAPTMEDFIASLRPPRVGIIMVKAGAPTDAVMEQMANLMDEGDIIVDCGNSLFTDTIRREKWCRDRGLHFVGAGVSGGEEGALWGPSIMPGGTAQSYKRLGPMFEKISAHVDGEPCCMHIGADGAGHFVKMVHNGIEYADMQVIAEAYDLLRAGLDLSPLQIADIFDRWNEGELNSYLIEITAQVLRQVDEETGKPLVDLIVDAASQKGTGKWTVQNALDLAVPVTGIAEATMARGASSSQESRSLAQARFKGQVSEWNITDPDAFIEDVRQALLASKIVAYSQGFDQITRAATEYGWDIDRAGLAQIWRGGCIIRAQFLTDITRAYEADSTLALLMAGDYFAERIEDVEPAWRRIAAAGVQHGIPTPVFCSTLAYFDQIRAQRLPASLIQGQRDFFGAHTYQRVDKPGVYHTLWAQEGRPEERQ